MKIHNWFIKKLGGYTREEFQKARTQSPINRAKEILKRMWKWGQYWGLIEFCDKFEKDSQILIAQTRKRFPIKKQDENTTD